MPEKPSLWRAASRLVAPGFEQLRRVIAGFSEPGGQPTRSVVPVEVQDFLERHHSVHLSGGGLGDAWLAVAMLSQEDRPHLLFGADPGAAGLAGRIFELFDIPALVVGSFDGSPAGMATFYHAWDHPHCVGKTYLPPHLDHEDWARRTQRYVSRLVRWLGVRERLGRSENLRPTSGMVALAPRGSRTCRPFERKFLSPEEYRRIVTELIARNCTVVSVGSESDLEWYGLHPHPNHVWHSSDSRVSYPDRREETTLEELLAVVNGCDEVISVDTWLKTYSALAGIPTTVIATRYDQPHENAGDHIFLNPIWGFRFVNAEDLCVGSAYHCECASILQKPKR